MELYNYISETFDCGINTVKFCCDIESQLTEQFAQIDKTAEINQYKVLRAMQKNNLSDAHFAATTGYGYNDIGRDVLEKIYADVFHTESSLVRAQIISGTHALTVALFGNLRYGDELLSVVGKPYDTLEGVIGKRKTKGSLIEHGITYKELPLLENGKTDIASIPKMINSKTKLVTIQRSKGYDYRPSLTVEEIKEIISAVKAVRKDIICMVDNCYGEFVDTAEPSEVGADLIVGSLIKNPGGGLAPVGGYIAGKEEYVENAAYRLTAPGLGKEVGPSLGVSANFLQGLFLAPQVVAGSLKGAVFASAVFKKLGFEVMPEPDEKRADIVQAIQMKTAENVISFCQGIQKAAPVDS
ncbi:MAG: methionine gamma-lyase family protein, partial [Firmicutes bacterium]|nr:methionine gamma-lyase family protein [Bacillota bacterium]